MGTGAITSAAFDLLARQDARVGALIGTGGQAAKQIEAMVDVRELELIKVCDVECKRAQRFVETMKETLGPNAHKIIAVSNSDEAVCDADLLITVTPSTKPVFDATKVKPGCTISCIGSYQHHMQEMDPVILERASKIYFESRESVLVDMQDFAAMNQVYANYFTEQQPSRTAAEVSRLPLDVLVLFEVIAYRDI